MPNTTVAENDITAFLASVGGDYVAAYTNILHEEQVKALQAKPRSNAELRKAAYVKAIATVDRKQVASMAKTLRGFLPLAKANSEIIASSGSLEEAEAEDLMVMVLEAKRLKEIAEAEIAAVRKRVFSAITEGLAEQGEEFPENQPGFIEVAKLGLKFTREGGGLKDPEVDEEALEAALGADLWDKVTTTVVTRTFDVDLFLAEARRKPALLEKLRSALKTGEFAPVRFNQRAMEPEE